MSGYMADQTNNYDVRNMDLFSDGDRGLDNTAALSRKSDPVTSRQAGERKRITISHELDLIQAGIELFVNDHGKGHGFTAKELAQYIETNYGFRFRELGAMYHQKYIVIQKRLSVIAEKRGTIYKPENPEELRRRDDSAVWEVV